MTDDEIDALEAGVRLDFKVAKACGVEFYSSTSIGRRGEIGPPSVVVLDENKNAKPFRPSSDWNDAMWAAEKARLFYPDGFLDFDHSGEWRVQELDMCTPEARVITSHKCGPVAICRAILKAIKNAST